MSEHKQRENLMTKLPAKKPPYIITRDIIESQRKLAEYRKWQESQPHYKFLSIKSLSWQEIVNNSFAAKPAIDRTYIVYRRSGKYNCYWFASVKDGENNNVILGIEFLTRFEAQEVCEAWEWQKTKPKEIENDKLQIER